MNRRVIREPHRHRAADSAVGHPGRVVVDETCRAASRRAEVGRHGGSSDLRCVRDGRDVAPLHVRQDLKRPGQPLLVGAERLATRRVVFDPGVGRDAAAGKHSRGALGVEHRKPDLLELILALRSPGGFAGRLHSRQEQADQRGDDRDHHEEFDECEAMGRFRTMDRHELVSARSPDGCAFHTCVSFRRCRRAATTPPAKIIPAKPRVVGSGTGVTPTAEKEDGL